MPDRALIPRRILFGNPARMAPRISPDGNFLAWLDVRCKVAESGQIVTAMRDRGLPVRYLVYPDEGHGFIRPENRLSFLAVEEAFYVLHLGGCCEPVGDDLAGSSITEH